MIRRILSMFRKEADYRTFLLEELPKESIGCEVGVWKGDFSQEILRIVKPRKLFLIDPWAYQPQFQNSWYGGTIAKNQGDMDEIYESVKKKFASRNNVQIVRKMTAQLSDEIPDDCLDWVYIDGNHQYEYVLNDLESYYPKMKRSGIICGDDYDRGKAPPYPITDAVHEFLRRGTCELIWIRSNQFFLRKM